MIEFMMKRGLLGLVFIFALQPCLRAQDNDVIEQIVAVVGEEIVLKSELHARISELKSQGRVLKEREVECYVLDDLLYQKLLVNQARLDSVIVEENQVEGELNRRMDYFVAQIGSEKALEQYFKKPIAEIKEELRDNLKEQLTAQRMQGEITQSIEVTPSEIKAYYNTLPKDSLPTINTEVEVDQIVFLAPVSKEENERAREKLNALRDRVIAGEDFATLAILYSEDPGTASRGGELGFVGRAEVDPAFAAAAFRLKGNETSRIVQSEFGLHILKLIARQGEKVNVRHILIKPQINGADIARARKKADSILADINRYDTLTFEEAAYLYSEDKESKNSGGMVVNPLTGASTFELDQLEPAMYNAIEGLKPGEISKPVVYKTRDGKQGYRLVHLKSRTELHKANLEQDYQRIQQIALIQKQEEEIKQWAAIKIKKTHIQLSETYKTCNFAHPWVEASAAK